MPQLFDEQSQDQRYLYEDKQTNHIKNSVLL